MGGGGRRLGGGGQGLSVLSILFVLAEYVVSTHLGYFTTNWAKNEGLISVAIQLPGVSKLLGPNHQK